MESLPHYSLQHNCAQGGRFPQRTPVHRPERHCEVYDLFFNAQGTDAVMLQVCEIVVSGKFI